MKAIYINDIDQRPYLVEKEEGRTTLSFLQDLVEGLIESVSLTSRTDLWVNEEGLFRSDFTLNTFASLLAGKGYNLVGPAVMTGVTSDGETVDIDQMFVEMTTDTYGDKTYTVEEVLTIRHDQVDQLRAQGELV
jgi:hypothetical protein